MIKHFLWMASVIALLCACSAEQMITDLFDSNKNEISAKLQLSFTDNATLQKLKLTTDKKNNTRAVFDLAKNEDASQVVFGEPHITGNQDMICVFRDKNTNKAFQYKFNAVTDAGKIDQDFTATTELTKEQLLAGDWYVMCFTSKNMENDKLSINKAPHAWGGKPDGQTNFNDQTQSPNIDVPFASLWKKVEVSEEDGKVVFSSEKKAVLRMLGTLLNLHIQGIPDYSTITVRNLTLISSGDTKGELTITPEKALNVPLDYTSEDDGDNLSAQQANAQADKYQAILNAMWQGTDDRHAASKLTYTHYDIENPETDFQLIYGGQPTIQVRYSTPPFYRTEPGTPNYRHDLFWFVMKESTRGENEEAQVPDLKRYKTQFLLHGTTEVKEAPSRLSLNKATKRTFADTRSFTASDISPAKPTETNSYASYPFWGTKYHFETGNVYSVSVSAPHITRGPIDALVDDESDTDPHANTEFGEVSVDNDGNNIATFPSPVGIEGHIPSRLEWQNIFPRSMNTTDPIATVTVGQLSENTFTKFAHYAHNHDNDNYTHIVSLRALPKNKVKGMFDEDIYDVNWKVDKETGFAYEAMNKTEESLSGSTVYGSAITNSLINKKIKPLPDNDLQCAIRIDYQTDKLVLTQRYLGPNFILDPFDIDTDAYWKYLGDTNITPLSDQEVQRNLPLLGYYTKEPTDDYEPDNTQVEYNNPVDDSGTIYWTTTDPTTEEYPSYDRVGQDADPRPSFLPFYINTKDKTQWWRTDNAGNKTGELYKDETEETKDGPVIHKNQPQFKALLRTFNYIYK